VEQPDFFSVTTEEERGREVEAFPYMKRLNLGDCTALHRDLTSFSGGCVF
jgi:hypothetical protein